jgi:hypothetical protein
MARALTPSLQERILEGKSDDVHCYVFRFNIGISFSRSKYAAMLLERQRTSATNKFAKRGSKMVTARQFSPSRSQLQGTTRPWALGVEEIGGIAECRAN